MAQVEIKVLEDKPIGPMLSRKDIQKLLNVSMSTADRIMNALPHVDVAPPGGTYQLLRMHREVFDTFIKERTKEGDHGII